MVFVRARRKFFCDFGARTMHYTLQDVMENSLVGEGSFFDPPIGRGDETDADVPGLVSFFEALARLTGRVHILVKPDGTYIGGLLESQDLRSLDTCLDLVDGVICATRPEFSRRLKEILAVKEQDVQTLILPFSMTDGHLIIRSTSISKAIICLSLHRACEMVQPQLANLEEVFNLTRAEAMIVFNLFLGHTPQQIAAGHNNSIHTVRAHIRRCYDKLGITCREELWRKLNAYRLV